MGDLFPNQAFTNPLWITPYDNFPLVSISQKEKLFQEAVEKDAWFTFYHDPFLLACRLSEEAKIKEAALRQS